MAKTSLAVINEGVAALLQSSTSHVITKHVAGFPIPAAFTGPSEWTTAMAEYNQRRDEIVAKLSEAGVTPLAVVPEATWQRMCRDSGLYVLHPDSQGRVGVRTEAETQRVDRRLTRWLPVFLGVVTMIALESSTTGPSHIGDPKYLIGLAVVAAVLAAVFWFCGWAFRNVFPKTGRAAVARILATLHIGFNGEQRVMQRMLDEGRRRPDTRVKVRLPTPPDDVAATLAKLADFQGLYVAVETGAVKFAQSAHALLSEALVDKWHQEDEERRRARERALELRRMAALDPIIAYEHRGVVAIVAQFGEFPIEQKVMERTMRVDDFRLNR
jgi:hypothetical protein